MDPTQRFSSRVDDYIKYRPSYPAELLAPLQRECGLTPASIIADVGSGVGHLTRLFLDLGCTVFGIEPNTEMRGAGERLLAGYARFHSREGRAETTGLPDASADFITAGQAFHWFDAEPTRTEWQRVLKPDGWVVIVWNERKQDASPFLVGYEALLHTYSDDYAAVDHRNVAAADIRRFLGDADMQTTAFDYAQIFDFAGLRGRLLSSSYAPPPGHPNHEPMLTHLAGLFDEFQEDGFVRFEYKTVMHFGRMHTPRAGAAQSQSE